MTILLDGKANIFLLIFVSGKKPIKAKLGPFLGL